MVPYAADPYLDLESDVTEIVSGTYQGKFYGIPIWGGVCLMWYNVPMFAENALPRPVDLVKANNWTWDTFLEVGRKLTADFNGDGQMDRFAIPQVSASWAPAWAPFVWQAGGDMIGEDGYTILVDSPETIAGLQFCVDLMWEYRIAPLPWEKEKVKFYSGTSAMEFGWVATIPGRTMNFEMDIVMYPAGPAGYYHLAGGCPVAISSTTEYVQEAYDFAKWYAMESGLLTTVASMEVIRNEYLDYLGEWVASPEQVVLAMSHPIKMEPNVHPKGSSLNSIWSKELNRAFHQEISVEQAVENIVAMIRPILEEE